MTQNDPLTLQKTHNLRENAQAQFKCASLFEYEIMPGKFDVVSAQGFIEYISLDQLDEFLAFTQRALKPNGALALGSRNRLFNLHALNEFTELEAALGTIEKLVLESRVIQTAQSQLETIDKLRVAAYEYIQPIVHPITGIKVDTRSVVSG